MLTLLGMEKAQHLFSRVYCVSGALADVSATRSEAFARELAASAGVEPNREGFASLTQDRLLELQKRATEFGPDAMDKIIDEGLPLGPSVDGDLIPRPTRESLRAGIGADKPLVLGATDDEFTMALDGAASKLRWVPRGILLGKLGVPKDRRRAYLAANADVVAKGKARLAGRVLSDRMFRTALLKVVGDRGDAPTWTYRFAWPSGRFGFAEHCLDVPFFFDCLDGPAMEPLAGPNPPQKLADAVHAAAVAFVRDGDPGWPRENQTGITRVFDVPPHDVPDGFASVKALL